MKQQAGAFLIGLIVLFLPWGAGARDVCAQQPSACAATVPFAQLSGWAHEAHDDVFALFLRSCQTLIKKPDADEGILTACRAALAVSTPITPAKARRFFEAHFVPTRLVGSSGSGFTTGYYEPEFSAQLTPSPVYAHPLYARPKDLLDKDLADIPPATRASSFPAHISGGRRDKNGTMQPYYDRSAILDGALRGQGLELAWLKDPFEVFLLQIQGSGRLRLPDNRVMRVGYDGRNGHPYTAVGRVLIERGLMKREDVTMPAIRTFLSDKPALANEIMRQNHSYVFFKKLGFGATQSAVGAQGLALTPWRSLAVDRRVHPYGSLFFLLGDLPSSHSSAATQPMQRLWIAQDTGTAIVGAARFDLFLGAGAQAEHVSGVLKHPVETFWLRPKVGGQP